MRFYRKSLVLPFAFALSACSSNPVDIGDDRVIRTGENLSDYAADWVGYVELSSFASGSDRIRMTLDEEGGGTVVFGEGPAIPPATDPEAWYPEPDQMIASGPNLGIREGYPYPIRDTIVESRRLRLSVDLMDLFRSWCELQTPYFDEATGTYACLPGGTQAGGVRDGKCYAGDADDVETRVEYPCPQVQFCIVSETCTCTQDGCTVQDRGNDVRLDASLESNGDELEGTMTGVGQVRMVRE